MAKVHKLIVNDPQEQSSMPFLRGILTRSLQDSGMAFDAAYALATDVRSELQQFGEVTNQKVRAEVAKHLETRFPEFVASYQMRVDGGPVLMVVDRENQPLPFSKNHLSSSLEMCGLSVEKTYEITSRVEKELLKTRPTELTSNDLVKITQRHLLQCAGEEAASRYLVWVEFTRSGRPLVLMVGGTTGCGKSTLGSEVAHRLNIVRTQSTDMLREVMRLMVPERLIPSLHKSSFNAWQALHFRPERIEENDDALVEGYLTQSNQVGVGIEAVIQRARRERISLIIEGVHLHPRIFSSFQAIDDAVIVPCIVAVLKKKTLRTRLVGRGQQVASRRSERYLKYFDSIWQLQSFLLDEADRFQIPIVTNHDQAQAARDVMELIAIRLKNDYQKASKS